MHPGMSKLIKLLKIASQEDAGIVAVGIAAADPDVQVAMMEAIEAWSIVEQLREQEGDSVEIVHESPDFGTPNSCIVWTTNFTQEHRFFGDSVLDCLRHAIAAKKRMDTR